MKKKKLIITVEKESDGHGTALKISTKGPIDSDMARFVVQQMILKTDKNDFYRAVDALMDKVFRR